MSPMNVSAAEPLTLEEYLALPVDDLYVDEVSRGRLVREPRPGHLHGRIVARLTHLLCCYLDEAPVGQVITEGGFLLSRTPVTVRGPDIAFVRNDRMQETVSFFNGAPDLAVEVVSPSNKPGELLQKVGEFLAAGTSVAWVVYPDTRTVVEHNADGRLRILNAEELLTAPTLLPGLQIPISRIFD